MGLAMMWVIGPSVSHRVTQRVMVQNCSGLWPPKRTLTRATFSKDWKAGGPVFPGIGKSRGNFSGPWKADFCPLTSDLCFFQGLEIEQRRREDGKKTFTKSW
jgi:hypothetical protein